MLNIASLNAYKKAYKKRGGYFVDHMYKKMYYHLFNAVTDAIAATEGTDAVTARWILVKAQQECEEIFLDGEGE